MDPLLALLIGIIVGAVLGALIGLLAAKARRGNEPAVALAAARATIAGLREQLDTAQRQYQTLDERVRTEREQREARERGENRVLQALAPVKESLESMTRTVADIEQQRTLQHGELTQQLRSSLASEEHLRATAESLASALRNNGKRGVWGEAQLRRLVEAAGLLEHVDFSEQHTVHSDAGTGRIDLVVHLSDGKSLAVDAKVPFESFLLANEIPLTAVGVEAETRARHLADHAKALRGHVDALAKREYWAGLATSPDLVVGFIPSESLLAAALETDPGLLDYAFRRNVALASPVSLWAVLKTVAYSWRQEAMSKDAKRVFVLATELFDRLGVLAGHAETLRRSIERTVNDYNSFSASLETRVLVTARRMNETPDPSRVIPETRGIDSTPRAITAPELIGENPPPRT